MLTFCLEDWGLSPLGPPPLVYATELWHRQNWLYPQVTVEPP